MITNFKIFENVSQAKSILSKLELLETNEDYIFIKELIGKNLGYLGQFTKWRFEDEISLEQIKNIYNFIQEVGLDKPINSFKTLEDVYDYLTKVMNDRKANNIIKMLPSKVRRNVNQKFRDLIRNNLKYSDSIIAFYKEKSSREQYKNIDNLIKDTNNIINNLVGEWNSNSIKYNKEELVYKGNYTLILNIKDYKRSCKLGTPDWCISTDESSWKEYIKNFNKQYFIYDFTKDRSDIASMLGVTISPNGKIYAAHYKNDDEIKDYSILTEYKQYLTPTSKEYIKTKIDIEDIIEVSKYGLIDEVKRLLKQGIDPSKDDNYAIILAARYGYLDIVKLLLLDKRVDPSDDDNFAIGYAAYNGHLDIVKLLLLDKRVDPSDDDNYAIRWAATNGHTEVVKLLLLDKRVDPSANNNIPIQVAAIKGHTEVVKLLLLDKRVDPSGNNNNTIKIAALNGYLEIMKLLLLDKRVDPSNRNNYAIILAASNGYLEIMKLLLLDKRVDPSDDNNAAIKKAASNGHLEIVRLLLLDKRVDPSNGNNHVIRTAAAKGYLEMLKLLLNDKRVDPSDRNNDAIQVAAMKGYTEVVKLLLLDERVNPSDKNNYAIWWAANNGQTEVVRLLLLDKRVYNSLSKEDLDKYSKMIENI